MPLDIEALEERLIEDRRNGRSAWLCLGAAIVFAAAFFWFIAASGDSPRALIGNHGGILFAVGIAPSVMFNAAGVVLGWRSDRFLPAVANRLMMIGIAVYFYANG